MLFDLIFNCSKSIWACEPSTTRGKPLHISANPQATSIIYCNGRSIIIRDLKNPAIATECPPHPYPTTVARFSPSGYYVASGDERGTIRVFDPTHPDQIIKSEFNILSGEIHDLAWDFESKRIIAVGNGREKFGHAFTADSGNSVGEISGHSKVVNTVAIRPCRPFRAATGSDDLTVSFFNGVPFKFVQATNEHARFVTCVRFAHDGQYLVSAATDGKWVCYDGATGLKLHEVANAHQGGIYAISCSTQSHKMITSSGDGTVKLWDMATQQLERTWKIGSGIPYQQLGNAWAGEWLLSVSLNGQISYLDERSEAITRQVFSHQKSISTLLHHDQKIVTGCFEGRLTGWDQDGTPHRISGDSHTNKVVQLTCSEDHVLCSVAMDATFKKINVATLTIESSTSLPGVPTSMDTRHQTWMATSAGLLCDEQLFDHLPASFVAVSTSCLARAHATQVFLHPLPFHPTTVPHAFTPSAHPVTALTFSSKYLVVGDSAGGIHVYDHEGQVKFQWLGHTARITAIRFSSLEEHAVSASLDTNIRIWSMNPKIEPLVIKNAHLHGVTDVRFGIDSDSKIISVGMDGCIKHWKVVSFP
ncbi:WD40 repeat-like protein [Coelomomyces lativittatus]|nr:WD40 repeat-like protein [Coelomomyces lativittatus]